MTNSHMTSQLGFMHKGASGRNQPLMKQETVLSPSILKPTRHLLYSTTDCIETVEHHRFMIYHCYQTFDGGFPISISVRRTYPVTYATPVQQYNSAIYLNASISTVLYSYSTENPESLLQRQPRMKIIEAFNMTCIGCGGVHTGILPSLPLLLI